jgi:peptide/nickel transport system permease protein
MMPSDTEGHAKFSRDVPLSSDPVIGLVYTGIPMKEYILHRCLLMIPTVLGVNLIVFLMMHCIPGDPISILMGDYYTPEAAAIRARYGLDRPLHSQYVLWLGRMISGDWGYSIIANRPIFADLMRRFPITIELVILAMGFALLIAIPAGVLASLRPYSWRDYTAMTTALIGVSIPEFFMGVLLILWFALAWRVLPAVGYVPLTESILGNLSHMILPAVTLGLPRAALLTRLIRASMLEVIRLEYVTTARAKGVRERSVVLQHVLKNALIPAVTVMGIQIGFLMGGAIVVETVFSVPGVGSFGVAAISLRDYPQVQAFVLLVPLAFVLSNLAVDILYAFLDPRIRYGKEVD